MSRRLVVTGDDFGARSGVNAAIARAHREGIVTSASLMVTGEAVEEAVALARELPELSTGLHLVFCDARPASPPATLPGLVTAEGRLPARPGPTGIAHALFWRSRRDALEREMRAQFELYLATGLPLDHVDGHHHLHMHPFLFERLQRCLEDYKVGWVRLVDEDPASARRGGEPPLGEVVAWAFRALARRHRAALRRSGVARAPDAVHGLRATGAVDRAEWLRVLPKLDAASVEVYTHPDTEGPGLAELEALCDPAVRGAVEAAGYTLAGTRDLAHGGVEVREP